MKLGSTDISKIYLGSAEVTKIYLGSTEVYNSAEIENIQNTNSPNK